MDYYICYPSGMLSAIKLDQTVIELFRLNNNEDPKSQVSGIWVTFSGEIYEAVGFEENEK